MPEGSFRQGTDTVFSRAILYDDHRLFALPYYSEPVSYFPLPTLISIKRGVEGKELLLSRLELIEIRAHSLRKLLALPVFPVDTPDRLGGEDENDEKNPDGVAGMEKASEPPAVLEFSHAVLV